ncbi:hypothetical protein [Waltera sp.]|uniref:hypothetical protein n=1 Tax=Waltera sp. TaxID=2815806 RepID=UPI0039A1265E
MFYKTVRRFLDPDGSQGGAPAGEQTDQQSQQNATPQIDYGKIQQMLDGTLAAKEDTALKAYFKQQGLSQQEVEQAIATFKEQKAANQPNVEALQQQAATAAAEARQAQIQQAATMTAVGLGISVTSIPYVLKMADFSQTVGQDGKISNEKLTEALNKVLEDIPALKPQETDTTGFLHVGTGGDPSQHTQQATVQQQQHRPKDGIGGTKERKV